MSVGIVKYNICRLVNNGGPKSIVAVSNSLGDIDTHTITQENGMHYNINISKRLY